MTIINTLYINKSSPHIMRQKKIILVIYLTERNLLQNQISHYSDKTY
jgi:hypothetical protein